MGRDNTTPLAGAVVCDINRQRVGQVLGVFIAPDSLDLRWFVVRLDADARTVAVPVPSASEAVPGELLVPYPLDTITAAPAVPEGSVMDAGTGVQLRRHYGFAE